MTNAKPTLLFVCVHNAGRSQLAAGLAALRGGDQVNILSAGLEPDDKVSDVALASLAEAGIDRSDQTPTKLTDDMMAQADVVVSLKPGLDLPHLDGCVTKPGHYPIRPSGISTASVRSEDCVGCHYGRAFSRASRPGNPLAGPPRGWPWGYGRPPVRA